MFGNRFFGARYFGDRYFGGGDGEVVVIPTGEEQPERRRRVSAVLKWRLRRTA